jgi:hypothetical protein
LEHRTTRETVSAFGPMLEIEEIFGLSFPPDCIPITILFN